MRFRPCIDIHNGKVKQIVGSTLRDEGDQAKENFVSERDGAYYARLYRRDGYRGGHVILLNPASSSQYEATRRQAESALRAWPGGLMLGGGVNDENAEHFLDAGASHVIVTSFVFRDGKINETNLQRLLAAVGREHLVLDVSCRRLGDGYRIVTDRWQKFTDLELTPRVLDQLADSCSEFLIHAVDAEGKAAGPEEDVLRLLGAWEGIPVTYAGGVRNFADMEMIRRIGRGRVDVTVGSALDLFGGTMKYDKIRHFLAERDDQAGCGT